MAEVDFWSATIKAYEGLQLSSPQLTPKLLQRPPFRFIHDLVTAINTRFQAYNHLFSDELQDCSKVDTKEKKIQYLTLLLDYVNKLLNISVDVSPKKIVSGHEAEKTNIFLQYVAMAVGYAQQDRTKREAEKQQPTVDIPPPPPPIEGDISQPPPPPAHDADPAAFGMGGLPNRSELPRKKSAEGEGRRTRNAAVIRAKKDAAEFKRKIEGYSLNLDIDQSRDIKDEGASIVKMWTDLQKPQTETTQSHMPADALEMAIQRQLDMLRQTQELIKESDKIVEQFERVIV